MKPEIQAARELLKDLTPLKTDCGAYCGGACCKSDSADEEGMLLFPGEEAAYCDCAWARVKPAQFEGLPQAHILVCDGRCPRDERPLACRLTRSRRIKLRAGSGPRSTVAHSRCVRWPGTA